MVETCGQNDNNPPTLELILDEANMRKLKLINEQIKKSAKYPKLGTLFIFPFSPRVFYKLKLCLY